MGVLLDNVRQGLNLLFTPVLYYGVVASIALQLTTWERGDRTQDKIQDQYANQGDHFDFIVVGGGTAGSVLANRLSQYYHILLLEAGGEPSPLQFVPGLTRSILNHPQVDWMHKTVAQKKSSGFSQYRRVNWPSGKGLGGSANLDFLMYLRGHPQDFDNWAKITKDPSWSYDNLLVHFQRAEDLVANSTDPGAHRHGGELRIQRSDFLPLAKEFLAAAKELGYQNLDLNGHFTQGFDNVYSTIKKGERQAPVRAFLDPIRKRKSLTIRKFAFVSKIKFRPDNTAYGVEYERHGEKYVAYSNREIILSAGTLGSPKILMLSGIGPKKNLEEFGVKTLMNLPVGQNLQDHVGTYLGPFFINKPLSFLRDRDVTAESYVEYGAQGTGSLTFGGFSATGLISSLYAVGRGEGLWPDLQMTLFPTSVDKSFANDLSTVHGLQAENLSKYYQHAVGKHSFHLLTTIARPAGRGELRLASRSATDPLVISPGYLEDPWSLDIKALVDGLKKSLRLIEGSTTFQDIGGRFTSEVLPGCQQIPFRSDEYFMCYLRQFTISMYNPVGTCAMGPLDSPFSVVDPQLKVLGTRGLRVIDASIMPSITSGGTLAPTIMIAEKGAQLILEYWSNRSPHTPKDPLSPSPAPAIALPTNHLLESSSSALIQHQQQQNTVVKPKPLAKIQVTESPVLPPVKFSTQMSKTETTTTKSVYVSPFSVKIKTSSATPATSVKQSTLAPNVISQSAPKSVSFPILTPKKPLKRLRGKPKHNFFQGKMNYFKTTMATSTTATPMTTVTTMSPFDFLSTTEYTVHPAKEYFPHGNSNANSKVNDGFRQHDVPTTFRPHLMLLDPEDPTNNPIEPTELVKPEVKQMGFGQSILYLVQKENKMREDAMKKKNSRRPITIQQPQEQQQSQTVHVQSHQGQTQDNNNNQQVQPIAWENVQIQEQSNVQRRPVVQEQNFRAQVTQEQRNEPQQQRIRPKQEQFRPTHYQQQQHTQIHHQQQQQQHAQVHHQQQNAQVHHQQQNAQVHHQQQQQNVQVHQQHTQVRPQHEQKQQYAQIRPTKEQKIHYNHGQTRPTQPAAFVQTIMTIPSQSHYLQYSSHSLQPPQHEQQTPKPSPQLLPFEFNEAGEFDDYSANDRFARHQNTRLRYLEKPIKVHTYRHPTRVVRRFPKPNANHSQHHNHQDKVKIIPATNVVYQASSSVAKEDPLLTQGSQMVEMTQKFKLNPLNPSELSRLAQQGYPISYSYFGN